MTDTTPTHADETEETEIGETEIDKTDEIGDVEDVEHVEHVEKHAPTLPAPMIIADGLDFGTGDRRCFAGLDFEIPPGRLALVTGRAGSGKSILLAALVGRFTGLRGRLEVAGLDAGTQSRRLRRVSAAARIGIFVDVEPKHSIADAVAERAAIEGLRRRQAEDNYQRLAAVVDLDPERDRLIEELDGYQRTALTVVLALLRPSTVVVLDDVHRDLNTTGQRRLLDGLVGLATETSTTIVVSSIETDPIGTGTVETTAIPYDAVRIFLPAPGASRTTSSR